MALQRVREAAEKAKCELSSSLQVAKLFTRVGNIDLGSIERELAGLQEMVSDGAGYRMVWEGARSVSGDNGRVSASHVLLGGSQMLLGGSQVLLGGSLVLLAWSKVLLAGRQRGRVNGH